MGRFCTEHTKDRTTNELKVKVAELEEFMKGKDPRSGEAKNKWATLLRCRGELQRRLKTPQE